ncbi:MAG: hypothetical protein JW931_04430 [Methanomicrobiaceae archaeon]|nr:hypothetical protein [Methanomicrobiaceae archaeon]
MKPEIIILLILAMLLAPAVSAASTSTNTAASYIEITSYEVSPSVFMKWDTGTIKVTIKNTGTSSVEIKSASLFTKDFTLINEQSYSTVGTVGPGTSRDFTFTIRADTSDGIYYPRFYLNFAGGGSLSHLVPVKVESTPLEISIIDIPDEFQEGVKESITVLVGNPRENAANGVVVKPESDSASFIQNSYFIGELLPDGSQEVTFDVIPTESGDIVFMVEYRNGLNLHTTEQVLIYTIGEGKKNAEMVINNVEVAGSGTYTVTGDVTNAGLKNAKSVIVTSADPAVPTDPNRLYVVGELEPDDFSSFEVTFTTEGATEVPLLILYKDDDGNSYEEKVTVTLEGGFTQSGSQTSPEGSDGFPVELIALVIIAAAGVGGAIIYSCKKQGKI